MNRQYVLIAGPRSVIGDGERVHVRFSARVLSISCFCAAL
jgi:hypothetical protein